MFVVGRYSLWAKIHSAWWDLYKGSNLERYQPLPYDYWIMWKRKHIVTDAMREFVQWYDINVDYTKVWSYCCGGHDKSSPGTGG